MTAAPRPVDALVAEIGSTTTVVSAFVGLREYPAATPGLVGQGVAATSVADGDVTIGVNAARARLEAATGPLVPELTLATSSAAGGLRMTVHGLTQRMTAMAAREAALGAGAVVKYQTAGRLRAHDLREIDAVKPNLILLAGGVEGGDCDTILFNAEQLERLEARPIVVYAGNSVVCGDAQELLQRVGFKVKLTSNVYPAVDELDIVPARGVIHDAFEEHITHAPGMERIGELVSGRILPTPGAVLIAAERLAEDLGDLVVIDVGGATTDVHSITDGSPEFAALMIEPQPHSKRTVEGDLGTYVSAGHVVEMLAAQERPRAPAAAAAHDAGGGRGGADPDALRCRHRRAAACGAARASLHADRPADGRARARPYRLPDRHRHRRRAHAPARRRGRARGHARQERRRGAASAAAGRARRPRPRLHLRLLRRAAAALRGGGRHGAAALQRRPLRLRARSPSFGGAGSPGRVGRLEAGRSLVPLRHVRPRPTQVSAVS